MEQQDHTDQPALPALSPAGAARRRIAGLGVSGVLMTVASTHGMADTMCKSPSGGLSGDLHTSHAPEQACLPGQTPLWWSAKKDLLATVKIHKNTKFKEVLSTSRSFGELPVIDVLRGTNDKGAAVDQGEAKVAALMMATYLNVAVAPPQITFLTKQAVLNLWANYNEDLHYNLPGSSKSWDSWALADYLHETQGG